MKSRPDGYLSERFTEALDYAREQHAEQVRKGSGIPYLYHLLGVASLVLEHGGDEDQAIAGLLHDVISDPPPSTPACRDPHDVAALAGLLKPDA